MYLRGKGYAEIAKRDGSGNFIAPFTALGDLTTFEAKFGTNKVTVSENISGLDKTVVSAISNLNSELTAQIRDWKLANMINAFYGNSVDIAQQTVAPGSEESLPNGLIAGDRINLANKGKVSSLVVKDSAGSPITLVNGTHYNHDGYGGITILALTGTQPYRVSYVAAAIKRVPMFVNPSADFWVRFWQKNTVAKNSDGSFKLRCYQFYQWQINPAETLALIADNEIATLPLSGTLLADQTKPESSSMSQYGDIFILDTE